MRKYKKNGSGKHGSSYRQRSLTMSCSGNTMKLKLSRNFVFPTICVLRGSVVKMDFLDRLKIILSRLGL